MLWTSRASTTTCGHGQISGVFLSAVRAVTVCHQQPFATATYTGIGAYDPVNLNPPPLPNPLPLMHADNVVGLSIPLSGTSMASPLRCPSPPKLVNISRSFIQVPFLNLMALIQARVGSVSIRVVHISALVNTKWYLGVSMNDTTNVRLAVAEYGERILGNNLLGLQVGNEPDLIRTPSVDIWSDDYFNEFEQPAYAMEADSNIATSNNLIGPNITTGDWTPEDVWNIGFVSAYTNNLSMLTVEHYPDDNCAAIYGSMGTPKDRRPSSRSRWEAVRRVCDEHGGFSGLSDSFGTALWALDYGLQRGYSKFSHAQLHAGGQDVYYNVPPPTNQSNFHQWTIGPIFYSVLAVAETLGTSGAAQLANGGNDYTPGYAMYEGGSLVHVALFNYMTDPSGAAAILRRSRYLIAPAVGEKFNITWGGQTFGPVFGCDGRLQGIETVQTVSCDQGAGTCAVTVPASGFALVSFAGAGLNGPSSTATFATTVVTQRNTATVNPSVLATSNGHSSAKRYLGSTSEGSTQGNGVCAAGVVPGVVSLIAAGAGAAVLMKGLSRQL
ncbi:glycoside hydrolase family 79 protein [Amylocystis lapponica]|nr:glycoside hydrolase family 79 protein [Amylocystis lapponica]